MVTAVKKVTIGGGVLALATAVLLAWPGAAAAAEAYKIGMSVAITGRAADTYAPTYEAYKAYFKQVNEAGGINGHPLEIVYEDDRGEPSRAAAIAKKFVGTDRVILIVNASISATYKPLMVEAETAKTPLLFGGGVCPREAFPPAAPLIFCSTSFGAKFDSQFAINFIKQQAGGNKVKVGFGAQDIPISRGEMEYAEQLAKEMGMETIPVVIVPGASMDFTPFASRLKEAGADWVLSWALWHVEIGVFEALNRLGWKGNYILYGHNQAQDELLRLKAGNLFAFGGNAFFIENLPAHGEVRAVVQKAGATYPVNHMSEGWVSAQVLETALRKCGWPCDKEKLAQTMGNLTVDTKGIRGGPIEWTQANHYRKTSYYKVYRWDRDRGRIVSVGDWARVEIK
jgi:ABC-type branched-subunit amino acid transport system substrate-binding protein